MLPQGRLAAPGRLPPLDGPALWTCGQASRLPTSRQDRHRQRTLLSTAGVRARRPALPAARGRGILRGPFHQPDRPALPAARPIASAPSVEQPYGWVVACVSMTMMAVAAGAPYLVVVALKPIAAEFGWPRAVPSLCYALVMLGAGFGGLLMGRWADRAGILPPAVLGALAIPFGAWWASTADGMAVLYLSHALFLGFLGNAAFVAPLLANATRWFDRRRGLAIALVASGQSLAGAIWPPFLRYLTDVHGWRYAFVVYALIALALLLPLGLLLRQPPLGEAAPASGLPPWQHRTLGWPAGLVQAVL